MQERGRSAESWWIVSPCLLASPGSVAVEESLHWEWAESLHKAPGLPLAELVFVNIQAVPNWDRTSRRTRTGRSFLG